MRAVELFEDSLNFDWVVAVPEGGLTRFTFPTRNGSKIVVSAGMNKRGVLHVYGVDPTDAEDNPDMTYDEDDMYVVKIDQSDIRKALRFIIGHFEEAGYSVKKVTGFRITGARLGKPKHVTMAARN